jgi:proteic killer suppression protein
MIRSFADDATKDIWNGVNSKAARKIPQSLWPVIQRTLDQIDSVTALDAANSAGESAPPTGR